MPRNNTKRKTSHKGSGTEEENYFSGPGDSEINEISGTEFSPTHSNGKQIEEHEQTDRETRSPVKRLAKTVARELEYDKTENNQSKGFGELPENYLEDCEIGEASKQDEDSRSSRSKSHSRSRSRSKSKERYVSKYGKSRTGRGVKSKLVTEVIQKLKNSEISDDPEITFNLGKKRKEPETSDTDEVSDSESSSTSSSSESESEKRKKHRKKRRHKRRKKSKKSGSESSSSRRRSRSSRKEGRKRKYVSMDYVEKAVAQHISRLTKEGKIVAVDSDDQTGINQINKQAEFNKEKGGVIESPSHATIYTPAVRKEVIKEPIPINISMAEGGKNQAKSDSEHNDISRVINEFIAGIRAANGPTPKTSRVDQNKSRKGESDRGEEDGLKNKDNVDQARDFADQAILDNERFKASIQPKGELRLDPNQISELITNSLLDAARGRSVADPDDDFFHITCHIEEPLKEKIAKGDFVDLEKLLPKNKFGFKTGHEDQKLDIVQREGHSFLVTSVADKENKITNVRKWDTAFRVYAAIYCKSNPHRASEIWQYVYCIHNAAQAYHWENVSFYDITFRHLMAANPNRSWAKTYLQGWSLAMRDPISKSGNHQSGSGGTKTKGWKDGICWRFNRNKCNRTDCNFEHKCSHCLIPGHSLANCTKKKKKQNQGQGTSTNGSSK